MESIIQIGQVIMGIAMIILVLIQVRGTAMGRGNSFSFTRRGLEKIIFKLTFVVTFLFLVFSFILIVI